LTVKLRENAPMPMLILRSVWYFVVSFLGTAEEGLSKTIIILPRAKS